MKPAWKVWFINPNTTAESGPWVGRALDEAGIREAAVKWLGAVRITRVLRLPDPAPQPNHDHAETMRSLRWLGI